MDDKTTQFSSAWEIDQLLLQGEATVTASTTKQLVVDFSSLELTDTPMFQVSIKKTSDSKWSLYGCGIFDDYANQPMMILANSTSMYAKFGVIGTSYNIRYFIFKKPVTAVV